MVLKRAVFAFLVLCGLAATVLAAPVDDKPAPNEVILPLADYLALVEKGETAERQRAREAARREVPVAEVVTQRTTVVIGEREAELTAHFEALVQGYPKEPLLLPFRGLAVETRVQAQGPGSVLGAMGTIGAVSASPERGMLLVAPAPGRYTVEVRGRAALEDREGVRRLVLAPVAAAVAEVAVDLPADLAWSAPGAVVVEDRVTGGRRAVRLAVHRGAAPALEIQRRLAGTEAEKLLAQSVVLTLFQLRPDGLRRHDVVLYEVSRGSLPNLSVDLPADLAVEQVATDEGDVVPVVDAHHLTVHRRQQLQGIGYLVLTSTPRSGETIPASAVVPGIEVRARYLTVASSVAADVQPTPAASWSRVDLSDLPPALGEALQSLDLTAAWRLSGEAPSTSAAPGLAVTLLPPSPLLPTLVRRRETTTLVTVDGTVLHRDRFTLDQAGAALDLVLPAGAVLWSAKVGEQTVRPVERQVGNVGGFSVPLGFLTAGGPGAPTVVEVVSVLERTIPKGRSDLALTLPQVASPVVEHQWRLLLPEGARYRFKRGDLRPVHEVAPGASRRRNSWSVLQAVPGVLTDRINVGGDEGGQQNGSVGRISTGATVTEGELAKVPTARELSKELQQGMVGGVKPLPVTIPETGKVLLLTGALPPAKIGVEIEVKGKR
ncbi:MAG: hypothetical protein QOJ16_3359 [Acidobacteriota bacterium]|nr:hypothetical protein [Acidobacteriota bacterium]